ncbi:MAG: hypothetical protein ACRD2W_03240 [Acidimicrobiales bacterium]
MRMRRWAMGGLGSIGAVVVAGATAWACVSGPAVNLSTINAKPGQEVTVKGTNFSKPDPVTVRWNSLDGPVLATLDKPTSGAITGTFTVPADAKAGNYVVIMSQASSDGKLSQLPVRALLTVTPENGAAPVVGAPVSSADSARPVGLVSTDNDISGATLALIGLGVAGVGMFVAGMAALFAGRRGTAPAAAKART